MEMHNAELDSVQVPVAGAGADAGCPLHTLLPHGVRLPVLFGDVQNAQVVCQ